MRPESQLERPQAEYVSEPRPEACVACGHELVPAFVGQPQEPSINRSYLLFRCPACGTHSTAGLADSGLYETGVYDTDATRISPLIAAVRRVFEMQKLRLLLKAVPPPARIVEAGAGQGRFVEAAANAGYLAGGFEPSERSVEIAAEHGIELQLATLEEARVQEGHIDAVVLWHVLEHLDHPDPALERIASWLRPGGAVLIGVPNIASVQAAVGKERWLHLDLPRHRHHFTPEGLRILLARHGLYIERERHLLLEHNPFGMWQAWLDRATETPAYAYNLVKRNAKLDLRDLLATLAIVPLAPLAALFEFGAGLMRRGGTIAVIARRG